MNVKPHHPLQEYLAKLLHGIGGVPVAEQRRMVNRACKEAAKWHENARLEPLAVLREVLNAFWLDCYSDSEREAVRLRAFALLAGAAEPERADAQLDPHVHLLREFLVWLDEQSECHSDGELCFVCDQARCAPTCLRVRTLGLFADAPKRAEPTVDDAHDAQIGDQAWERIRAAHEANFREIRELTQDIIAATARPTAEEVRDAIAAWMVDCNCGRGNDSLQPHHSDCRWERNDNCAELVRSAPVAELLAEPGGAVTAGDRA